MQGNTHYPYPIRKGHIFQEILPPFPPKQKVAKF
jgi:hypothetical protein